MRNKLVKAMLGSGIMLAVISPILAQNQTNESTNSGLLNEEVVRENIKQRIEKVVQENTGIDLTQSTKMGWIGTINSITSQTFSLESTNASLPVSLSEDTEIFDDEEAIEIEDLEIGTHVVAVGTVDNNEIMNASTVVTIAELPVKSSKLTIMGSITEIDTKSRIDTITIFNTESNAQEIYQLDKDSLLELAIGKETQELEVDEMAIGDTVVVIYEPLEEEDALGTLVNLYVIKQNPETNTEDLVEPTVTPKPTNQSQLDSE